MRGKDKNYFHIFSLKRVDFVENSKNPTGAFNKRIIKSVYYDFKIIYRST